MGVSVQMNEVNALGGAADGPSLRDAICEHLRRAPVAGSPAQMRARFRRLVGHGPLGEECEIGGVRCVRHGRGAPVLWLHGGGYVFGDPGTHARAAQALARLGGVAVLVPDYRLAPEHPWPAPLDDICAIVDALPEPAMLVGDSAGGHLALNVALRRPDQVRALALISPNTDRTGRSPFRQANNARDLLNSDADDTRLARMAMPAVPDDDPEASPILADLSALPPVYVTAATNEVLFGDTVLLMQALARAGHHITADILSDLWHMWPLWPGQLAQADLTLTGIAKFLNHVQTRPA